MASKGSILCLFCNKSLSSKSNEWKHLLVKHLGETPYNDCSSAYKRTQCEVCDLSVISVHAHMATHKRDKPFKCIICKKGFKLRNTLNAHIRSHTLERPFKCGICGKSFRKISDVQNHCEMVHEKRKNFSCVFCNKSFSQKNLQWTHLLRHIGETPYKDFSSATRPPKKMCEVCNKFVGRLSQHKLIHIHGKPFKCGICKARFKTKRSLNVHAQRHNPDKVKCNQCNRSFYSKDDLRRHCKVVHDRRREYSCIFCDHQFSKKYDLHDHLLVHIGETPYNDCSSAYRWKWMMRRCHVCNKSVKSGSLSAHMITHKLEKPHKCNVCGKGFKIRSNLHTHERTHTGEKPFKCDRCGKAFSMSGHLYRHRKIVHEKRRGFSCVFCNKSFGLQHSEWIHYRHHIQEKPFSCQICGESFCTTTNRMQHWRNHHNYVNVARGSKRKKNE